MRRPFPTANLLLLLATVAATLAAGTLPGLAKHSLTWSLWNYGLPQCGALLFILGVHEMGHYLFARAHRVDASLPYFIPLPVGPLGTLGAVIKIRSPIPTRNAVLDIGASGPLAGFAVALPLLLWGYRQAAVVPEPLTANHDFQSPFHLLSAVIRLGHWPLMQPQSVAVMGDSLLTWLAERLTHGQLPNGMTLELGPVAFAAWVGMYVTTLNLTPVGQLDGGHVIYALFGRHAPQVSQVASWVLLGLGLFGSWSWLIWWALLRFVVGFGHPPPTVNEPLSPRRRAVAIASLAVLALTFVPLPFHF